MTGTHHIVKRRRYNVHRWYTETGWKCNLSEQHHSNKEQDLPIMVKMSFLDKKKFMTYRDGQYIDIIIYRDVDNHIVVVLQISSYCLHIISGGFHKIRHTLPEI